MAAEEAVVAAVGKYDTGFVTRPAGRAIVIHNNKILVMRRNKNGRKYMVTPGGRLETGESPETALIRELAEETMVDVADPRLVFVEEPNDDKWGTQYIFLCRYVSGEPQLHPDSDEQLSNFQGKNIYEPTWQPLDKFPDADYPFKSSRLADEIIEAIASGFPESPKRWTLTAPVVE